MKFQFLAALFLISSTGAFASPPPPTRFFCTDSGRDFAAQGNGEVKDFLKSMQIHTTQQMPNFPNGKVEFKVLSHQEVTLKDPNSDASTKNLVILISYTNRFTPEVSFEETETMFCRMGW